MKLSFNDYEFIGSGWTLASSIQELFLGMGDARYVQNAATAVIPEYFDFTSKKELFTNGITYARWRTTATERVIKILEEEKNYDLYQHIAAEVYNASNDRVLLREVVKIVMKYPIAFGFSESFMYQPEYQRYMYLRENRNLRMFRRSTVSNMDTSNVSVVDPDLAAYVAGPITDRMVRDFRDIDFILTAARRGVLNSLLYPNSRFHVPCVVRIGDGISPITDIQLVDRLKTAVGPDLVVDWEYLGSTLRTTPLSLTRSPTAAVNQFPFRVLFADSGQRYDENVLNHLPRFDPDTVFTLNVRNADERDADDERLDGHEMFNNLFEITEFSVPIDLTIASLPSLFFRR
jgi:hypothetical protein